SSGGVGSWSAAVPPPDALGRRMSSDLKPLFDPRLTQAFGVGVDGSSERPIRMLEQVVSVQARGTHDVYDLVASDGAVGVLQVTLPLRPPAAGERLVLETLAPAPSVHLMA